MTEPTTPKLNIVCALKAIKSQGVVEGTDEKVKLEAITEHTPSAQRGTWNKGEVKFFVKGEPDELFEARKGFMTRAFNVAATEWDIELKLIFTQVQTEEEADIIIEWGLRVNDPYYGGPNGVHVLAYAGYPDGGLKGYMKIFTDWDWDVKGSLNFVTMVIHELGHIIGRPHSERKLWKDIMDPAINSRATELSDFDILGGILAYGIREYSTDTGHDRLEAANRHHKNRLKLENITAIKAK